MRAHFARHLHAAALALSHRLDRRPGAHVRDVNVAAGHLREQDVASRGNRFRDAGNAGQAQRCRHRAFVRAAVAFQRLIFAVLDHRHVEHARVLERAAREDRRRHRQPVIGHRHAAGLFQFGDVGELFALLSPRHRANWIHARQSGFRGLLQDQLRHAGVVVDRLGVRHARHGGEAACHRRRGARRHRFLVLLPRLAQVHVHVDESRAHHKAGRQIHNRARHLRSGSCRLRQSDRHRSTRRTRRRVHWPGHDPPALK